MKNNDTVPILQIILLMMTVTGLKNHVIAIPPLIIEAGRDAWISVIAMSTVFLVWGFLFFYVYHNMKGEHIFTWLEKNIGTMFTNVLMIIIILYLIIMSAVTVKETILWTNVSYLVQTPPLVLTMLFIIPCTLAAISNIKTLMITNFFILALVIVFGFFIAFTNIQFKDYSLLLPFFENGLTPVVRGMIYQGSGLIELTILFILQHKFQSIFRVRHFIVLVLILTGLTLGPLIGAIIEFGPTEAALQRYPAYEEWGLARLGKYVEHVDYLSIYQWLSGAFIRIALLLYTIKIALNINNKKVNTWIVILASTLVVVLVIYPIDEKLFFTLLTYVLLPFSFWFFLGLSVFLGIIATINRRKEKRG